MANSLTLFLCIVIFGFGAKHVAQCHPNIDADWVVEVNNYALYLLARESELPQGASQAQSVLKKICELHRINYDFLDSEVIDRLRQKIRNIMKPALKAIRSGGVQGQTFLEKLEKNKYQLKLGGLKRKLEHDLESERKRRKIAENETKETNN